MNLKHRKTRADKAKKSKLTESPLKFFYYSASGIILTLVLVVLYCYSISDEIPSLSEIENPKLGVKTVLYSRNNEIIGELYKNNRTNISYDQLPKHLVDALVSTEDRDFFDHSGINVQRMFSAVFKTVINKLTGLFTQQGGGTITMQTARLLYTGRAGTVKRKLLEMMIALKLERTYSKKEILEIFFNLMFYGYQSEGIATAAKTYFNKTVDQLSIEESAILVGLLQRPSDFNPIASPELSKNRRNLVFYSMAQTGAISLTEKDSLQNLPVIVNRFRNTKTVPYFRNRLEKELISLGKDYGFDPYTDGLQVYTTLDTLIQNQMDSAIANHIGEIQEASLNDKRTRELRNRYLKDSIYVSEEQADSAFKANHVVQYGFITIDQKTGEVLGHKGGREGGFYYDHVFQGRRQPGSLIKPFVYAQAIENGFTASDPVIDERYVIIEKHEGDSTVTWTPENWDKIYRGIIPLRQALYRSANSAVLHLQDQIGGPSAVRRLMRAMQIESPIVAVPSLPLGVNVIRPIELVAAYGAFANGGVLVENHTIQRILDKNGNIVYSANPVKKEVINQNTAFILTSMLESAVNEIGGTAVAIRRSVSRKIKVAAKTGTTNDHTDIWCTAYTPRFTTMIWFGLDNPKHKINLWSSKSVPVIGDFINRVYKANPDWEYLEFNKPEGIVEVEVTFYNGKLYRASPDAPNPYLEYFRKDNVPTEVFDISKTRSKSSKKTNKVF